MKSTIKTLPTIRAAIKVEGQILIEIDKSIVSAGKITNGELFEQFLTEDGILLRRTESAEVEDEVER